MKKLEYKTVGEFSNERLTLTYDSQVIYEGYTDHLITSETNDLELKLNYGLGNTYPVIARRHGNHIIWIPKYPLAIDDSYQTIIFNVDQFNALWTYIKYEPEDDLSFIKDIRVDELKLVWLVSARRNEQVDGISDLIKSVKENVMTLSTNLERQDNFFYNCIENQWTLKKDEIVQCDNNKNRYIVYLDQGRLDEWEVFKENEENHLYIHLGKGYCLPV